MISKMTNSQVGMLGVHLAELIRRGLTVAITSREARGADLLVTDPSCQKAWSVQVKTTQNKKTYYCIVGKSGLAAPSDSHIWIFVHFVDDRAEFLVVPSKVVAKRVRRQPPGEDGWLVFDRKHFDEGKWDVFGKTARLALPRPRRDSASGSKHSAPSAPQSPR